MSLLYTLMGVGCGWSVGGCVMCYPMVEFCPNQRAQTTDALESQELGSQKPVVARSKLRCSSQGPAQGQPQSPVLQPQPPPPVSQNKARILGDVSVFALLLSGCDIVYTGVCSVLKTCKRQWYAEEIGEAPARGDAWTKLQM
ncbi:hypothetical protein DPEC_G00335200 [Dallia pectoralis]|uniref:Uncharacterized protein n=1 Tax=Dallia pectoralis TaxID=75939 RepID=A0ACC2F6R3_DALPE|nr:hypothetical protein DPEC_G00335200 [Dallia pectoralis]